MPSPYDRLRGDDEYREKKKKKPRREHRLGSKTRFDILLAAAILILGLVIGGLQSLLGGRKAQVTIPRPATYSQTGRRK